MQFNYQGNYSKYKFQQMDDLDINVLPHRES